MVRLFDPSTGVLSSPKVQPWLRSTTFWKCLRQIRNIVLQCPVHALPNRFWGSQQLPFMSLAWKLRNCFSRNSNTPCGPDSLAPASCSRTVRRPRDAVTRFILAGRKGSPSGRTTETTQKILLATRGIVGPDKCKHSGLIEEVWNLFPRKGWRKSNPAPFSTQRMQKRCKEISMLKATKSLFTCHSIREIICVQVDRCADFLKKLQICHFLLCFGHPLRRYAGS